MVQLCGYEASDCKTIKEYLRTTFGFDLDCDMNQVHEIPMELDGEGKWYCETKQSNCETNVCVHTVGTLQSLASRMEG